MQAARRSASEPPFDLTQQQQTAGNDATSLRVDPVFKMALERLPSGRDLCSQSTISRLQNLGY
jgi:hypothetical protein